MATNNSKRRILIFSTAYYPFVGGAEVAIKEITDRLGNDFDFDLITARLQKNSPEFEKIGNVNVYRTGVGRVVLDKLILPFVGVRLVSKLYKQNNYFCFWAMMVTFGSGAGFLYNIFRKLSGRKKIPIILTLQEGDSESHLKYKWAGLIALSWKLALWQTDFLTGISNFLLNKAKRNGYKKKVFLVPNGVDVRIFSQKIEDKTKIEIKKSLAKKEGDVLMVLLESDESIRKSKGGNRPINTMEDRARISAALKSVDIVVKLPHMGSDKEYDDLIEKIQPAVLASAIGDRAIDHKKRQAKKLEIELKIVMKVLKDKSTTNLVNLLSHPEFISGSK